MTIHISVVTIGDCSFDVAFTYSPGLPGRNFLPNGDPGYPEEPAEVEIIEIHPIGAQDDILEWLSDTAIECIQQKLLSGWSGEDNA